MTDLLKWHQIKFPRATVDSQKLHLEEEMKEFGEADELHILEELADIYIVAISLQRWDETKELSNAVLDFYFNNLNNNWRNKVLKAVEDKINVINAREYFWNGRDYDRKR